jgi:hypothetical protein
MWVNRCRVKIHSRFLLAQAAVLRWEQLARRQASHRPITPRGGDAAAGTGDGAVLLDRGKLLVALLGLS